MMIKKLSLNLLLLIFSLSIAFFIAEIFIRETGLLSPIKSGWSWASSPLRTLQPPEANIEVNQLGLRGKKFEYSDDDFVVLLLGDSQVEAAAVSFNNMPENILEKKLNKLGLKSKVFSLASSGWGQDQQLLALNKYFRKWRADQVILWSTPGNDFWENAFIDRSVTEEVGHIKPTYIYDSKLHGPYYEDDFYLYNSAVLHLLFSSFSDTSIVERLHNQHLEDITEYLSESKNHISDVSVCNESTLINQGDFFRDIFELDDSKKYTVKTNEDIPNSRSHFSPFTIPAGKYDKYLVKLTTELFAEIRAQTERNQAQFNVLYPVRQDFDVLLGSLINCVQSHGKNYLFFGGYLNLLKKIVHDEELILIDINKRNEIVVSKNDRHMNQSGIKLTFEALAVELAGLNAYGGQLIDSNELEKYIHFADGWSIMEQWGIWSEGQTSDIHIKLSDELLQNNTLRLNLKGHYFNGAQETEIFLNGIKLNEDTLDDTSIKINVSDDIRNSGILKITLKHHEVISPADLGVSADVRNIKYGLQSIEIVPVK